MPDGQCSGDEDCKQGVKVDAGHGRREASSISLNSHTNNLKSFKFDLSIAILNGLVPVCKMIWSKFICLHSF